MLSRFSKFSASCFKNITKLPTVSYSNQSQNAGNFHYKLLIKPFLYTTTICGVSFSVATIAQFENKTDPFRFIYVDKYKQQSPFIKKIQQFWDSKDDGFKVFCGIAALNTLVFLCWRIPRFQPIMTKYFLCKVHPSSIRILPMILSTFSHFSPYHLGLNMFVLHSFSSLGVHSFGKENFLALYLSSGIVSSFASCLHKVIIQSYTHSLGASGAILGILAAICIERPDIQLMIIFLPFFQFSSYMALKGLIIMDTLGLIMKFGFFDHAAHLGGTLFGIYYAQELRQFILKHKMKIINYWKDIKKIMN